MEYVPGGELSEYIESRGKLEETEACRIFQQIISAIEYLHFQKIAHRDLKPENILLDYKNDVKIIDFGLSNLYKSGEKLKSSCGSPCYAPPEMILNKPYDPLKADIWSAGIILHQMVCGHVPFEDDNTTKLYHKIVSGKFTLPPSLSIPCQHLISSLLSPDPSTRYSISDIKHSTFYLEFIQALPKGIIKGYNEIPIVTEIERILKTFNIDIQSTFDSVKKGIHDRNSTIYYLVLQKYIMTGEVPKEVYQTNSESWGKGPSFECAVSRRLASVVKNRKYALIDSAKIKGHKRVLSDHLPSVVKFCKGKEVFKIRKKSGSRIDRGKLGESLNFDRGKGSCRKNTNSRGKKKAGSLDEGSSFIFKTR